MPHMLGENFLPESVMQRRRQVRDRLQSLRQPIKSTRESLPGPNVIGQVENSAKSFRDKFVSRQNVLSRIKNMRSQSGSSGGNSGGSSGGSSRGSESNNTNTPAT